MSKNFDLKKLIFIIIQISFIFLLITLAIFITISFTPLHKMLVKPLGLVKSSGLSNSEINYQYRETIRYILGFRKTFDTTYITITPEGIAHFSDVRKLVILNNIVLIIFLILFISLYSLFKIKKYQYEKQYSLLYYPAKYFLIFITSLLFLIIITGFEKAFTIFHKLFFPGKDNYTFDPFDDSIINILPWEFFLIMGLIIALLILIPIIAIITYNLIKFRKLNKYSIN